MSRSVLLSNGCLAVGLTQSGLVQDFYYPYVGLDNLCNARLGSHRIGLWVDGDFSWVDSDQWQITADFSSDALMSNINMVHEQLRIKLIFVDFVDQNKNFFGRRIQIENMAEHEREIRIFMHQVFQISRSGRADTALYVPDDHYILDYKGRCCLLIAGKFTESNGTFDQYAVGNFGIEGKEGTFRDAEDGELSGSAVEHGGVDSVIRFVRRIPSQTSQSIDYWIVASDSQHQAEKIHNQLKEQGLSDLIKQNQAYWHDWLSIGANALHAINPEHVTLTKKSLLLIKAHIDKRGGIIASADSSIYNYGRDYYSYVWPRDGAFAIWPLIRLGYYKEAQNFFHFCRDILTDDGYLMHKYQPDKAIGSTWHPLMHENKKELAIQEDETAVVLYMLGEYYHYSDDADFIQSLYETMVRPMADFLCRFIDEPTGLPHASYDLWEEKFLTSTYTVASVYQSLLVAKDFAEQFGYPDDAVRWSERADSLLEARRIFFNEERGCFRKGFLLSPSGSQELQFDNTVDLSSLYGVMIFDYAEDDTYLKQSMKTVERHLLDKSPIGGTPRYEHDQYFSTDPPFMGNPWFVTTLWVAQYYIRMNNLDRAAELLRWSAENALPSGVFSEQIHPQTGEPLSVAPLVWSHAEYVNTVLDYTRAQQKIS